MAKQMEAKGWKQKKPKGIILNLYALISKFSWGRGNTCRRFEILWAPMNTACSMIKHHPTAHRKLKWGDN